MAILTLVIRLETTPEYDEAVREARRLRIRTDTDALTPADQLGEQADRHLRGLRHVKDILDVSVTTEVSRHQARTDPTPAAVVGPEGKKKAV